MLRPYKDHLHSQARNAEKFRDALPGTYPKGMQVVAL